MDMSVSKQPLITELHMIVQYAEATTKTAVLYLAPFYTHMHNLDRRKDSLNFSVKIPLTAILVY